MKTELVWEGKYDEYGNRREVDVAGAAMPLQKIETIDEPRSRAEARGSLFDTSAAHLDDFRNMLIWGDNKLTMASLLKEFRGKIDLIYIDPPFDAGADFTMQVPIGSRKELTAKDQSMLEMIAYRDMWGRGTDSYLSMIAERLLLMKELLTADGSIYVHLDSRVNSMVRLILDETMSPGHFINEIIWKRLSAHNDAHKYGPIHDTLLFYSKGDSYTWNPQLAEVSSEYRDQFFDQVEEESGRRYARGDLTARGTRRGETGKPWRGIDPNSLGNHWKVPIAELERLDQIGKIHWPKKEGGMPRLKRYEDEVEGVQLQDIWADIKLMHNISGERTGYATQKPEPLLERIIQASSNPGDLIADFFCGSGTTGAVAERLGRRWIMADLGRFAIHTSRKRLIDLQRKLHDEGKPYRAFDVLNLGRYERQWWQKERLHGADEDHRRVVLEFFRAEPIRNPPSPLIHGRKGPALVHVDAIDGLLTRAEVEPVAQAAKQVGATEVICLAWEYEMDLRLECTRLEAELDLRIRLVQIPREIMEKNRTSPPPFFEIATLEAEPVCKTVGKKRVVDIKLTKFVPSLAEVPSKELEALQERAIKSGFDFIDFWAVDFDYHPGGPFNHHWQEYRTRKDRSLVTVSDQQYEYETKSKHTACVKVVDIFGCDTSITVEVDV